MCGISGVVSFSPEVGRSAGQPPVRAMLDALAHRGPDASAVTVSRGAVFGATRLAIRAPADGPQPMLDAETGVVVVCNGEIDNHGELRRWLASRGRSVAHATDVAVILPLYLELGPRLVEWLIGPFAFALWDPRMSRLVLARDRAGERSIFYASSRQGAVFATELGALVGARFFELSASQAALHEYLRRGVFPAPSTPLVGVRKVAPGEVVEIDERGVRERRYWRWQPGRAAVPTPSLEAFDAVFRTAVARQTDIDVPFGVFLSGGIDSSLVAAVAQAVRRDRSIPAYTVRFEERSFDEGEPAAEMAAALGLAGESVWMRAADVPAGIAQLVSLVGEPLADPAWLPEALLARHAAKSVRVVLVGEGADELFGGYPTYIGAQYADAFQALPAVAKRLLCRLVRALPVTERKVTLSCLLKRFVDGAEIETLARHRLWTSSIPPGTLERLGLPPAQEIAEPCPRGDALDHVQRWDFETSLAEGLLTKADRAGMCSALELRAPFLDVEVMEFAARLPKDERASGPHTKIFLKRYAARYLPRWCVRRRKRGLSVPLSGWLKGPLHAWADERLRSERLADVGIRRGVPAQLLAEHRAGWLDHARSIWTLLVLVEWLDWFERLAGAGA